MAARVIDEEEYALLDRLSRLVVLLLESNKGWRFQKEEIERVLKSLEEVRHGGSGAQERT